MAYTRKTLNVKIPKGIGEGQQIRLAGQGLLGFNGGQPGDLYLKIRFHDSADLYVKNQKDVYQRIDVMPWQAVLGGKIEVNTIAGTLGVTLPAGSRPGQNLRLKGKGIPAKTPGDLYLNINIVLPQAESEAVAHSLQWNEAQTRALMIDAMLVQELHNQATIHETMTRFDRMIQAFVMLMMPQINRSEREISLVATGLNGYVTQIAIRWVVSGFKQSFEEVLTSSRIVFISLLETFSDPNTREKLDV